MSDEVSDFLKSVEGLKAKRDEEDEARQRELEEKLRQERRERQLRREERARSLSPQKSSPANTPPPSAHRREPSVLTSPPPDLSSHVSRKFPTEQSPERPRSTSPTKREASPLHQSSTDALINSPSPSASMPTRNSTLSWQRRPTSQTSADRPRSRPLSVVAAENAAARASPPPASSPSPTEQTISRDQIANALLAKDPSWFRQSAEGGRGTGAFRKNQVEDEDTIDVAGMSGALPGMSRGNGADGGVGMGGQDAYGARDSRSPGSPSRLGPTPRFEPPGRPAEEVEQSFGMSSGRTSPTRPASPTKGGGGFVQSAMMKRTDSVKRWSVNSPAGLQRAGTVVASRPSRDIMEPAPDAGSRAGSRPTSRGQDTNSRPTSSHSRPTSRPSSRPTSSHGNLSPRLRDKTPPPIEKKPSISKEPPADADLPISPSRTMDQRRWSPTKSSWLDAALNKPDSPKPKAAPPANAQPAWMSELNKAKNRGPGDEPVRAATPVRKHEVQVGGLARAAPMGQTIKTGTPSRITPAKPSTGIGTPSSSRRNGSSRVGSTSSLPEAEKKSVTGPLTTKTKPETPPKKDFTSTLKSRSIPTPSSSTSDDMSDFKNVVGNLRRTKTQNYVAPDELKNNILRGKAALNVTDGPRTYKKQDDFKEAILKKKEQFKEAKEEGRGIKTNADAPRDTSVPEGLAKRAAMVGTRTGPSGHLRNESKDSTAASVVPGRALPSRGMDAPTPATRSSAREAMQPDEPPQPNEAEPEPLQKKVSAPARLQSKPTPSAKAGGFGSTLAGLLARGPPGAASSSSGKEEESSSSGAPSSSRAEPSTGPQLTHMTKGRARGPKRKAPTSVTTDATKTADPAPVALLSSARPNRMAKQEAAKPKEVAGSANSTRSRPRSIVAEAKALYDAPVEAGKADDDAEGLNKQLTNPEIQTPPASIKTRPRSPTKVHEQAAALAAQAQQASSQRADDTVVSPPMSPSKLDLKRRSQFLSEAATSKPDTQEQEAAKSPPLASRPLSLQPKKSKPDLGPVKSPETASRPLPLQPKSPRPATDAFKSPPHSARSLPQQSIQDKSLDEPKQASAEPVVSVKNGAAMFGGAVASKTVEREPTKSARPEPLRTPLASPVKETAIPRQLPQTPKLSVGPASRPASPVRSPLRETSDISGMITEFFGMDRPRRSYNADTSTILMNRKQAEAKKIKTTKTQLFQLLGDGKKAAVPSHFDNVLFEREMYLCPHAFMDTTGRRTQEVYFWVGDEVPQALVEDTQFFATKEAKNMGCTLITLHQGKESPEFLQALGGLVVIRRGTSSRYDSLAPEMLCGRRCLDHVVFDQVDFSSTSLCSGFPYLIAKQGRCHLWKGKGSGVDELSCARLIGMDLALMGELNEVDEGSESQGFWDEVFEGEKGGKSADHWRLKRDYERYGARLFLSDASSKEQISEIRPFTQSSLLPFRIYILDAFFEMYIIVGHSSQSQYSSFHNALEFAQEYAILAAGMEDRPFVPVSTVVLEGIPRDLRACFRKWDDEKSPTRMVATGRGSEGLKSPMTASGLKRGRSLRVVPLTQALQALNG